MDHQNLKCSSQAGALAFSGGAMAGVAAGSLLAPRSVEETRRGSKNCARKVEKQVREQAKERRPLWEGPLRGKSFISEKTEDGEAVAKVEQELLNEKLDTCCN